MKCPKCNGLFNKVLYEDIQVDRCNSCNGLWFDALELQDLLKKRDSDRIDVGDEKDYLRTHRIEDIHCPVDNSKLIKMVDAKQGHIWFESCGVCKGIFLDATEFKDLHKYSLMDLLKSFVTSQRKA